MEDVLDLYHLPYDPRFPLICMDESNKQLVGEVATPIPAAPGRPQLVDHEYVRNGVAEIFMEVEPLAGRRHVAVTEQRTRKDWAGFIKSMLDERYPEAEKIRLVMDNLTANIIDFDQSPRLQSFVDLTNSPFRIGKSGVNDEIHLLAIGLSP